MRAILSAERVGLNYLQRMSGIATYTHQVVSLLEGTGMTLVDTRKTTPNMRVFEKYAVTVGGGKNHRYNLSDGVLLKDNHISAAGGVAKAIAMAKAYAPFRPQDPKSKRKRWTWSAKPSEPVRTSSCWIT